MWNGGRKEPLQLMPWPFPLSLNNRFYRAPTTQFYLGGNVYIG